MLIEYSFILKGIESLLRAPFAYVQLGFILKGIESCRSSPYSRSSLSVHVSSSKELKAGTSSIMYLLPIFLGFILKGIERERY